MPEREEGGIFELVKRTQGWIATVLGLITGLSGLYALFGNPAVAILWVSAIGGAALWLMLLQVCRSKRSARHDPSKKHYIYSKGIRRAALAGLIILPAGIALIFWQYLHVPPLPCPTMTVTITRFGGDDDLATRIQNALALHLERQKSNGIEVKPNRRDFVIPNQGSPEDTIEAAKGFGNSRKGHGNIVLWGEITAVEVIARGAIVNKCDVPGGNPSTAPQTPINALTDAFEFYFNRVDFTTGINDFAQFVVGLVLYEQGYWQESANVLSGVQSPFGTLYEGLARQELGTPAEARRAIKTYSTFFSSKPDAAIDNQSKWIAVAAYINASNALLDLSNVEPENASDHLENAFNGYIEAINRYDELTKAPIKVADRLLRDAAVSAKWRTIAQTNLAIAKIRLAAGDKDKRPEWLHDAERDFKYILSNLDENQASDRESRAIAESNLGSLCLELARVDPEREKRLIEAEEHLVKALAALDGIHNCGRVKVREGAYDCAVVESNLGSVFLERAFDEKSRDEALNYLTRAQAKYANAIRLFSTSASNLVDSAEEMSEQGLVLIEQARWFDNAERERLLRKAVQNSTEALGRCDSKLYPLEWTSITNDLAYAERELGKTLGDNELLMSSVEHCKQSLSLLSYDQVYRRTYWAEAQCNLGKSLYAVGVATGNRQQVTDATLAYKAALQFWTDHNAKYDWTKTQEALGQAQATLANGL